MHGPCNHFKYACTNTRVPAYRVPCGTGVRGHGPLLPPQPVLLLWPVHVAGAVRGQAAGVQTPHALHIAPRD